MRCVICDELLKRDEFDVCGKCEVITRSVYDKEDKQGLMLWINEQLAEDCYDRSPEDEKHLQPNGDE